VLLLGLVATAAHAESLRPDEINTARYTSGEPSRALVARLQIMLDRAGISPGVIDGRMGENVEKAIRTFRLQIGLGGAGTLGRAVFRKLRERVEGRAIVSYRITEQDIAGPFTTSIPAGFAAKRTLQRLGYTGPAELLAEKFHMDEDFLRELNPGVDFSHAGARIDVANIRSPAAKSRRDVTRIDVDKSREQLRVYGPGDALIAAYPATVGSTSRPAPTGDYDVKGVATDPTYTYDPEYDFAGVEVDEPFTIAPGPNNPVGDVWIDLSKEGYGIHGTPAPALIGKTSSHGCVRLTNWDARALADMVEPGDRVRFIGGS
jgi:lipoprotein-anchoring transpeptidase ErfK/SrfK